jgi:putative flavoprotein involved in K+ transport
MTRTELIIIGAGQAGLAAAYAARRTGVDAVVLEASDSPTGSWPTYYDSLRLFSPARYSALPERPFPGDPERYPARDEVVEYLRAYAEWLEADIRVDERVERVDTPPDADFLVETATGGVFRAPRLIAATGGFGSPHRPALPGLDEFGGRVLHSAEYRAPDSLSGGRVLVVGGGNSAVQIAAELAETSNVTLTTRSPLRWFPQRPLGRDLHWWLDKTRLDWAPLGPLLRRGSAPILDDGRYRAALARKRPDHRPMFERLVGNDVVWSDGQQEQIDAIILATGFRPDLPFMADTSALDESGAPLHCGGVSPTVPGLGYVGLQSQRSFASATIRGVGRDAAYVLPRLRRTGARAPRLAQPSCCPALATR